MSPTQFEKDKTYNDLLTELFKHGVSKVQPQVILKDYLSINNKKIFVTDNNKKIIYSKIRKIFCLCIGKAAVEMAVTAKNILNNTKKLEKGVVVVNSENFKNVKGFKCFKSGHPIPNKNGYKAAKYIESILKDLREDDLVLVFISGGGSALLPYPVGGVSLKDKIKINKVLLESGANIKEINSVRKHISKIKGGNLAKMCFPSFVHSFILSDVVGDDLSSIASGMTAPDQTTFTDVLEILKKYKILKKIPENIRNHFVIGKSKIEFETPKRGSKIFKKVSNTLIGSNNLCIDEIKKISQQKKIESKVWIRNIDENVVKLAKRFVHNLKTSNFKKPILLISGGETTVKVKGKGKGGRNQEFALHLINEIKKTKPAREFFLLSAGTDGRDGPTNAAGGIVNHKSINLIKKKGINLIKELKNNNSYQVLKKINSLVIIKGTNTNVADIQLLYLLR